MNKNIPTAKILSAIYTLEKQAGVTKHFTPNNQSDAISYLITLKSKIKEVAQEDMLNTDLAWLKKV
jgi:hypothetical protein